jgi:hypothetical protein
MTELSGVIIIRTFACGVLGDFPFAAFRILLCLSLSIATFRHFRVIGDGAVIILKHASERLAAGEQPARSVNGLIFGRERLFANLGVVRPINLGHKVIHSDAPAWLRRI